MTVSVVNVSYINTTVAYNIPIPAGWQPGDLFVVSVSGVSQADSRSGPPSPIEGLTFVDYINGGAEADRRDINVYYRILQENDLTFNSVDWGTRGMYTCIVFRSTTGWDTNPIIPLSKEYKSPGVPTTTITLPGGTTLKESTQVLGLFAYEFDIATSQTVDNSVANSSFDSVNILSKQSSSGGTGFQHYSILGNKSVAGAFLPTTIDILNSPTDGYSTLVLGIQPIIEAGRNGSIKVWDGSAWATKTAKVWNGSAWVTKPVKVWDGSAWTLN